MSAARNTRDVNITPRASPLGPHSSDDAVRNILAKRAARIDELEIENARLQSQLEDALSRPEQLLNVQCQSNPTAATAFEPANDFATLKRQYEDLEARHMSLQADYDARQRRFEVADKKYLAAKESAKQWKAYLTKHLTANANEGRQKPAAQSSRLLQHPLPSLPQEVSDIDITPKPLRQALPEEPTGANEAHKGSRSAAKSSKHQVETSSALNESTRSPGSSLHSKRITSSQTTEDDQAELRSSPIKAEAYSDEEPLVVRENILRRERGDSISAMPPPRRIKQEPESPARPGSAEEPIELRSEQWSSPLTKARPLIRTETSDLDAMRGTFQTPRKRKSMDGYRARSEERSNATLQPPPLPRNTSSLLDSDIPELPELSAFLKPSENHTRGHQAPHIRETTTGETTPQGRSYGRQRGALHQLSPNIPTLPQTAKKRRRISEDDAGKVSMLAEDGDESTSQVTPKTETGATKTPGSHRLDAMLENPTPGRQPLGARRPASDTAKRMRPQRPQHQHEPTIPTKSSAPASRYRRPPGLEKSPPPIDPESEPLRCRPLRQLRPQDFRINPAFADSDYAFVDPMNRKTKAARRCLPGCINPACCGEFLDAARHGLLPPSSKSDAEVIKDMFGPSHAEMMAAYPPSKHAEILIQARAQEFSNKHGRHRKTFERAATPPGFWRTEMPSTQEELEDRRKAEEMERMKVEGMWREAMRGGGRWIFKDE